MVSSFASWVAASFLLVVGANACAQSVPPLRTGLWEMRADREVDGRALVKQKDFLNALTVDNRARVEEVLRHKRGSTEKDDANVARLCLTNESLADGRWQGIDANCASQFSERDNRAWKWHASCRQAETDGIAVFASPERYDFRTETTFNVDGVARVMKTSATMTWLGTDCSAPQ